MTETILAIAQKPVKGHTITMQRAQEIAEKYSDSWHCLQDFSQNGRIDIYGIIPCLNQILIKMQPEWFYVRNVTRTEKELRELTALLNYFKKASLTLNIAIEYGANTYYGYIMAIKKGGSFVTTN